MPDQELQSLYDEANRRGMFKTDPELQALGHEARLRGMVTDPTQGGLVPAPGPVAGAPNALAPPGGATPPVLPPVPGTPEAPTVAPGNLAPPGGAGARVAGAPSPPGGPPRGAQPFAASPQPSAIATLQQNLDAEAKRLSANRATLAQQAKELDVANELMRSRPFEFPPERLAQVKAKFDAHEQARLQQIADETNWQQNFARLQHLPAGSVPTAPGYDWRTPQAFSVVGNYQNILNKLPATATAEQRQQAETDYNQSRVAQAQEFQRQVASHDAIVRSLNVVGPQLAKLKQQAEQGQLTPATVVVLNQQLTRLRQAAQTADLQLGELNRVKTALDKWDKDTQGKWIHNGQYFPWELNPDGTPHVGWLQNLFIHATPLLPAALDQARQIVGVMQKQGLYPATPIPPANLPQAQRDEMTSEKNALWGAVADEYDLQHQKEAPGIRELAAGAPTAETVARRMANLTAYQRSILDITRQQYAGWQKALTLANTPKAFERGAYALAGGMAAGGIVGGILGPLVVGKLAPETAALLTGPILGRGVNAAARAVLARALVHGVIGGPVGAVATGTTTGLAAGLMGAPLPKAVMLGIQSMPQGAVVGAGASAALGIGTSLAAEGAAEVAGARQTPYAEPPPGAGTTGGRVGAIEHFTPEEQAAREAAAAEAPPPGTFEKRAPGTPPPNVGPRRDFAVDPYTAEEDAARAAARAQYEAALARRASGEPRLKFEEPAISATNVRIRSTVSEAGTEPVVTSIEGEAVPYRMLTPEAVDSLASRFAAAIAQGTLPAGQEQDAAVAQGLLRDVQAYDQQRRSPSVAFADPRFSALWKRGKIEGAKQYQDLMLAADSLDRRGKNPELSVRLRQAAQDVQRDALFDYGNNLNPPPAGTLLPPPLAAPYRSFTPEELAQIAPVGRQALLVQDISNSLRVAEPASPGVYALNQIPGAKAGNLETLANEYYAKANDITGATYSNIPAAQVSPITTASTAAATTPQAPVQPGAIPIQPVSPAVTAAAPPPGSEAAPAGAPSVLVTQPEVPVGQQQPERSVSAAETPVGPGTATAGEGTLGFGTPTAQPGGVGATGLGGPLGVGTGGTGPEGLVSGEAAGPGVVGTGSEAGAGRQRSVRVGSPSGRSVAGRGAGRAPVALAGGREEPAVAAEGHPAAGPQRGTQLQSAEPVRRVSTARQSPLEREGVYVPYEAAPEVGGKPHPAPMVETRALAAVRQPTITHTLLLPQAAAAIQSGQLSAMQLEGAALAGQRHSMTLGDGSRAGFLSGIGTGGGKTIMNAAIIADNWERNTRKTVYLSVSPDLAVELGDALKAIGYGHIPVKVIQKFNASEAIPADFQGVIFTTYASFITKGPDSGTYKKQERRAQLQRWLGHGSDGSDSLVIFDESQQITRATAKGAQKPSQRGAAALKLQQALPGLRVVYSSATAASDLGDMGYMSRLGLWGQGTPWRKHAEFVTEMAPGGTKMLELIARDLKAQGAYVSREISFEGTEYEPLPHSLTEEQRGLYNQSALFWRNLRLELDAAIEEANLDETEALVVRRRYWDDHQRFFKELLTAFKVPTVVAAANADIAAGRAPVISLVGTGEARQARQVRQAAETEADLDELDFSPAEIIGNFIATHFPQENQAAAARAQALTKELADTLGNRLPQNPLDELLMGLGHERTAEVSGRRHRIEPGAAGELERVARGGKANQEERAAFMEAEKPALIFSGAGATGFGYHAAVRAKNQGRRVHYVIEHGWSTAGTVQGLGRTHRAAQVSAPIYRFVTTDAAGEARFAATVASRLAAQGAITHGERAATGGGDLAQYDVDNALGRAALDLLVGKIKRGEAIEGLANPRAAFVEMGLAKATASDRQNVKQFLNRLMGLEIGPQNALAAAFWNEFDKAKALAIERGRVDPGAQALAGTGHTLIAPPQLVHTHPTLGTENYYYRLEAKNAAGQTIRQHLLTGAVLPLWEQLKIGQQKNFRAYTVNLPEGEIIGIAVAPNSIKRVLEALGTVTLDGPVAADFELGTQVLERRLPSAGAARLFAEAEQHRRLALERESQRTSPRDEKTNADVSWHLRRANILEAAARRLLRVTGQEKGLKGRFQRENRETALDRTWPNEPMIAQNFDAVETAATGEPLTINGFRQESAGGRIPGTGVFYGITAAKAGAYYSSRNETEVEGTLFDLGTGGPPGRLTVERFTLQNPLVIEGGHQELVQAAINQQLPFLLDEIEAIRSAWRRVRRGGERAYAVLDKVIAQAAVRAGFDGVVYRDSYFPTGMSFGNGTEIQVLHPVSLTLPEKRAAEPAIRQWQQQFAPAINAIVREVAARVLSRVERAALTRVDTLLLPAEETGVTMGATVREGGKVTILISPFVPTAEVQNGKATATWTVENNDPNVIAGQLMQTIVHELAHLRTPSEGEELDAVQAEMWNELLANEAVLNRAVERLYRLLTGGTDDLVRTYREGRDVHVANQGPGDGTRYGAASLGVSGAGPSERTTLLRRLPAQQTGTAGNPPASRDRGETVAAVYAGFTDSYTIPPSEWRTLAQANLKKIQSLTRVHRFLDPKLDAQLSHLLSELDRKKGASKMEAAMALAQAVSHLTPKEREKYDWTRVVNNINEEAQRQARKLKGAKPDLTEEQIRAAVDGGLTQGRTRDGKDFNWTMQVVSDAWRQNEAELAKPEWAKVRQAIIDRRRIFKEVEDPYLAAMQKANGRKIAFDRDDYMHQEALYFLTVARLHRIEGTTFYGEGVPQGRSELMRSGEMRRGFLKERVGSLLAYQTDSLAADLSVLSQMIFDTLIFEIKSYLQTHDDMSAEVLKAAMAINFDRIYDWTQEQVEAANHRLGAGGPALTADDVFRLEFRPKQDAGFARLFKMAGDGMLPDTQDKQFASVIEQMQLTHAENEARAKQEAAGIVVVMGTPAQTDSFYEGLYAYLQWLGSFESGKEGATTAQKLLRAPATSRRAIKDALLGSDPLERLVTPEHLIRAAKMLKMGTLYGPAAEALAPYGIERFAELTGWRPGPGNAFRRAWGVQDRIADTYMLDSAEALGLEGSEDLTQALASLRQDTLYLPDRIVATLSEMAQQRPSHFLEDAMLAPSKSWRSWIILGPPRLLADFARRQLGHLNLSATVHPQAAREALTARREIARLLKQRKVADTSSELARWIGLGGLQTTTQQFLEMGTPLIPWKLIPAMKAPGVPLQRSVFTREGAPHAVRTYFEWAERFQDYAEAIWRYAHYRAWLSELRATHAKQGGPEQRVRPKDYAMSNPTEIDALETLDRKAFALSEDLMGAYSRLSSGGRALKRKVFDIPFLGFKETMLTKWGNLWLNGIRGNGAWRELRERMEAELGWKLLTGGTGPPQFPPPPPGGPGDPDYDDWEQDRKAEIELWRENRKRWQEILWLLKNGRLTAAAVWKTIVTLGLIASRQMIWNATVWAWNQYPMGERLKRLPPYIRNRGFGTDFIILPIEPRGSDEVIVFNRISTGWEALHLFGLDNGQAMWEAWNNGGMSGLVGYFGSSLVNSAVESAGPTKTVLELTIGERLSPDIFSRRPIPNRIEYAADTVALGNPLRWILRHPQPEGRGWTNLLGMNQYDGREQNYLETMDWMRAWRGFQPGLAQGPGTMSDDEKSRALWEYKRALRQGLNPIPYLRQYLWFSGGEDPVKGLKTSFQRMEPLYGLTDENYPGYRRRLLLGGWNPVTQKNEPGLTPAEQTRLRSAYFYVSDLATPAVSAETRVKQGQQPILKFVDTMEQEIDARLDAWLAKQVAAAQKGHPELSARQRAFAAAKEVRGVEPKPVKAGTK